MQSIRQPSRITRSSFDDPVGGSTGPLNPVVPISPQLWCHQFPCFLAGHLCSPIFPSESCRISSMSSGRGLSPLLHFLILPSHCQPAAQPPCGDRCSTAQLSSYSDRSGEVLPSNGPPQNREQAAVVSKAL